MGLLRDASVLAAAFAAATLMCYFRYVSSLPLEIVEYPDVTYSSACIIVKIRSVDLSSSSSADDSRKSAVGVGLSYLSICSLRRIIFRRFSHFFSSNF